MRGFITGVYLGKSEKTISCLKELTELNEGKIAEGNGISWLLSIS